MGGVRKAKAKSEDGKEELQARRSRAAPDLKPSPGTVASFLQLQRTIGNQAVCRLAGGGFVQPKLSVGPARDRYEREADQVADEVMRNLSPTVEPEDAVAPVRRYPVGGVVGMEGGPLGADTEAKIQRERGGGARLPRSLQASMEQSFGADFGGVRVHTGPSADDLSRSMQARAFTVGGDIYLARGQYQPQTASGQRLLAHELTHTVQQGAVGRAVRPVANRDTIQRLSVYSDDLSEWSNLASGKASGGVNGVVFATGADGSKIVVKGMAEPPQRVMLAQDLMADVGVATAATRPVAVNSDLGQQILQELGAMAGRLTTAQDPQGSAINTKIAAWHGFQTLLLMAPANIKSFSDLGTTGPELGPVPTAGAPRQGGVGLGGARGGAGGDLARHVRFWQGLVNSQEMWDDFGRIYYIDQFLGNEDRFETMKVQNIFIDPTTYRAVALDNDTQAADYISNITEIDAISNKMKAPKTIVKTMTPAQYIDHTIKGGTIYNPALQARAIASLDEISGTSRHLQIAAGLKVAQLLGDLHHGFTLGQSVNDQAGRQVLTAALADTHGALTNAQKSMTLGAVRARERVQELFRTQVKKKSAFRVMFDRQLDLYDKGFDTREDVLYNFLALTIRYRYLAYRALKMDDAAAQARILAELGKKITKMSRTAKTEETGDPFNPTKITKLK